MKTTKINFVANGAQFRVEARQDKWGAFIKIIKDGKFFNAIPTKTFAEAVATVNGFKVP